MADISFMIDHAKSGRSKCKNSKCKQLIDKGALRIGKIHPSPFHEGLQTDWYHSKCMFDVFGRARATTKKIDKESEITGFDELPEEDKEVIRQFIAGKGLTQETPTKTKAKGKRKAKKVEDEGEEGHEEGEEKTKKKKKSDSDEDDCEY